MLVYIFLLIIQGNLDLYCLGIFFLCLCFTTFRLNLQSSGERTEKFRYEIFDVLRSCEWFQPVTILFCGDPTMHDLPNLSYIYLIYLYHHTTVDHHTYMVIRKFTRQVFHWGHLPGIHSHPNWKFLLHIVQLLEGLISIHLKFIVLKEIVIF